MSTGLLFVLTPVACLFGYFVIGELILGHWLGRQHFGHRDKDRP